MGLHNGYERYGTKSRDCEIDCKYVTKYTINKLNNNK